MLTQQTACSQTAVVFIHILNVGITTPDIVVGQLVLSSITSVTLRMPPTVNISSFYIQQIFDACFESI